MERQKQFGGVIEQIVDRDMRGNVLMRRHKARFECMLDSYLWYGVISFPESEVGKMIGRAYQQGVLHIKVDDPNGAAYDPEMAMLIVPKSEEILRKAYAVLTPAQKKVIIAVCGHDESAGTTDRAETLQRGLERLTGVFKVR